MKHQTKLYLVRKYRNLSVDELSEISGINPWTIRAYESQRRNINHANAETLIALAKALDCKTEHLIQNTNVERK